MKNRLASYRTLISTAARTGATAMALTALHASPALAIGGDSDGWITPTPGHPLGLIYQMRNSMSKAYADGDVALNNAQFTADVTLFRYVHPVGLANDVVWSPNVIVPYVGLKTDGNLSGLGQAKGVGDLMLVSGFWPIHEGRKHLAIVPYLWLPTGKYNKGSALNTGENRYKTAIQVGGQMPIGDSAFDFAGSVDTTFYGKNKDTNTKQKPLTEINGWLKYNLNSPLYTHLAVGLAHVNGGETEVAGVAQKDKTATTTLKLQLGTMVDESKTNHVLFTVARDINIKNGLKVDNHVQVRYLHVF